MDATFGIYRDPPGAVGPGWMGREGSPGTTNPTFCDFRAPGDGTQGPWISIAFHWDRQSISNHLTKSPNSSPNPSHQLTTPLLFER